MYGLFSNMETKCPTLVSIANMQKSNHDVSSSIEKRLNFVTIYDKPRSITHCAKRIIAPTFLDLTN